jgi:hypothetical protein
LAFHLLTTHVRLVPRLKNGWSCTPTAPIRLHGVVLRGSTRTGICSMYVCFKERMISVTCDISCASPGNIVTHFDFF